MSFGDRTGAMAQRVARAAERAGFGAADVERLDAALQAVLERRLDHLGGMEHPELLHPGRTVLVLVEDLEVADPDAALAGALCETLFPELAPGAEAVRALAGAGARRILGQVPHRDAEGSWGPPPSSRSPRERDAAMADRAVPEDDASLLERLVTADEIALLVALAERLDHARHLHLRPEREWAALHAETCDVYRPVAERAHPTLARRYRWWCKTFERKFLRG